MTNANEALRRFDDALKRIDALESRLWHAFAGLDLLQDLTIPPIDALEEQLERAIQRINALEDLVWDGSADVDELAVSLGEPSP